MSALGLVPGLPSPLIDGLPAALRAVLQLPDDAAGDAASETQRVVAQALIDELPGHPPPLRPLLNEQREVALDDVNPLRHAPLYTPGRNGVLGGGVVARYDEPLCGSCRLDRSPRPAPAARPALPRRARPPSQPSPAHSPQYGAISRKNCCMVHSLAMQAARLDGAGGWQLRG